MQVTKQKISLNQIEKNTGLHLDFLDRNQDDIPDPDEVDKNQDGFLDLRSEFKGLSQAAFQNLERELKSVGLVQNQRNFSQIFASQEEATPTPFFANNFVRKYAPPDIRESLGWMTFVFDLDPNKFSLKNFGGHLARQVNAYINSHPNPDPALFQQLAVAINRIYQNEGQNYQTHKFRKAFVQNLSPKAAYYLVALGGADLFTSNFLRIWEAQDIQDLKAYVEGVDPEGKYAADFFLVLGQFGKTELFKADTEFYLDTLKKGLRANREEKSTKASSVWISALKEVYGTFSEAEKSELADFLVEEYNLPANEKSSQYQAAMAFWIAYFADRRFDIQTSHSKLVKIAKDLPEIELPKPSDLTPEGNQALKDIQQFFDPFWYNKSLQDLQAQKWQKINSGRKAKIKFSVYQKRINGRVCQVVLVLLDNKDSKIPEKLRDENYIFNVLRVHSFETASTHEPQSSMTVDGSCGGYSRQVDVDPLSNSFQRIKIADKNIGQGNRTFPMTVALITAIAYKDQDWARLTPYEKYGIVLPTDPGFLLAPYVRTYVAHESAKTQEGKN